MAEQLQQRERLVENPRGKSAVWKSFFMKEVGGTILTDEAICQACKATIKTSGGTTNQRSPGSR